jgi:hypothetical protein
MSSTRRSAGEVNILDMLDRQANGPLPRRMLRRVLNRPAPFWYGAAGLLVCTLVGTLAWLARDGTAAAVDTAQAGSIKPAVEAPAAPSDTVGNPPLVASAGGPVPAPEAAPEGPLQAAAAAGATIVDLPPPGEPEAPAPAVVAPAHVLPPQQAAGRIATQAVPRDPPRPAAHAVPAKAAPHAGRAAALAHTEAAGARSRRQPAPAKAASSAVDTDVALISAIIQHAANRQEAEESGCADKACGARKP